ncbi:hypothetical protein [Actinomadura luteofluorescens]|uniref:hypothetical protein n=1 Tax=Actinomadura luteofluorescens TaxID=46163 RepID=UPI0030CC5222
MSRLIGLLSPLIESKEISYYLRMRVNEGAEGDPAALLHSVISAPDFDRGEPHHPEAYRPSTVDELRAEISRVNVIPLQVIPFLQMILTTDFAYLGYRGPLTQQEAESIAREVVDILGPEVRWWSNVRYPAWAWECGDFEDGFTANPVTWHTYDCAMIGVGNGVAVTFLAYADD